MQWKNAYSALKVVATGVAGSLAISISVSAQQQCVKSNLPERDLYIIIGQSNAAGLAAVDDLAPPAKDYISANTNFTNVEIYGIYGAGAGISGNDDAARSSSVPWSKFATWNTAKPGFGFKNLVGNERYFPPGTSEFSLFGPEMYLAHLLDKNSKQPSYILKLAVANTALAQDGNFDNWAPGSHLYKELLNMLIDASMSKSKEIQLKVSAIFLSQGESDSMNILWAKQYERNLKRLIEGIRDDLFNMNCSAIRNIPFVMTRVQDNKKWVFRDIVRKSQEKLSRTLIRVKLIETDDLIDRMAIDGIHFNEYGQMKVGERFYFAAKDYK